MLMVGMFSKLVLLADAQELNQFKKLFNLSAGLLEVKIRGDKIANHTISRKKLQLRLSVFWFLRKFITYIPPYINI